jgi:hypothetical protein
MAVIVLGSALAVDTDTPCASPRTTTPHSAVATGAPACEQPMSPCDVLPSVFEQQVTPETQRNISHGISGQFKVAYLYSFEIQSIRCGLLDSLLPILALKSVDHTDVHHITNITQSLRLASVAGEKLPCKGEDDLHTGANIGRSTLSNGDGTCLSQDLLRT